MKRGKIAPFNCLAAVFLTLAATACDDGRIYPDAPEEVTGGKGTMTISFRNEEAWPEHYMLVFAALGEEARTPIVSKVIPKPSAPGDPVTVTLSGLDEDTKALAVSVVNKGRELLYTFYSYPVEDTSKEMVLPISEIDLAGYDRVQQQVFNAYCIRCHGAGEHAAANLNLTEQYSPQSLVNIQSTLSENGRMLVLPGRPSHSFLPEILKENIIGYNHTDVLPESELIDLVDVWIETGADE